MKGSFRFGDFGGGKLLTNDAGRYAFLTDKEFGAFVRDELPRESEVYRRLLDGHFCYEESEEAYIRGIVPGIRANHGHLFSGTSLFILALTNECNNRCVYCQANGGAKAARMDERVARQILLRIAECPTNRITIEFQGGEPLMNFPVIRYVVEQASEILKDKKIEFCLVSNLILLTDEMAAFFAEHNVSVSTSLDGPRGLHDANRPKVNGGSSHDAVVRGLELLRKHGIEGGAIQTTTRQSLAYSREIPREYARLGFRQIFIRPLTRLGKAGKCWDEIGYGAEEYLAFYRDALEEILRINMEGTPLIESHASIMLNKIVSNNPTNYMELQSPCGAAFGQMAFTANGNVYTCDEGRMLAEEGDEAFLLGNVFETGYEAWVEHPCARAVCAASMLEVLPNCCDCVYQPYCGVCPVVNYALNKNVCTRSEERCKIYKGIFEILFGYLKQNDPQVMEILKGWCN